MSSRILKTFSLAFLAAGLLASPAFSKAFTNQFVEFQLPFKWDCALEGAEWVCQSLDELKKRDAIIVLAAKLKGEQDSLDKYQDYLNKPRVFNAPNGKSVTSQPKYAKMSELNGHPWVDAMHLESEIPGFYTRYLATVKEDIGVLVTYSVNKDKYQEYLTQFDEMIKSLKVFRKGGGINTNSNQSIFNQVKLPGSVTQQGVFQDQQVADSGGGDKPKSTEGGDDMMLYLILAAVVVGFIIYKKKKAAGG